MKPHLARVALGLLVAAGPSAEAATFDLSGTWSYTTTGNWVKGPCPKGQDASGTLQISQSGDSFTLKILGGMVCNPASMCSYSGTIAGAVYTALNSAVVDNEGGKATNTITFTASSATAATGSDSSSYVHPGGMTCTWGFNIALSRDAPDGGGAPPGDGPGKEAGAGTPDSGAGDTGAGVPDSGGAPVDAAPQATSDDDGCAMGGTAPGSPALLLLLLGALLALRRRRAPPTTTGDRAGSPARR